MMKKYSFIYIILAASIWGIEGFFFLPHLYSLPVALVVFIQTGILSLLLTPFFIGRFKGIKQISQHDWIAMFFLSLLGGVIGILAITKSFFFVNYVNLSIVVLIQKLQPVFALSFAAIFLKEKLNTKFVVGSVFSLIGAYIMTFGFSHPEFNTGGKMIYAVSLSLLAAASFGATTVLTRKFVRHVHPLDAMYLRFVFSALILGTIVFFMGDYGQLSNITSDNMKYFSFWIITGGIGIFLFNKGLKHTKASVSTFCELSFPLTVILLEFFMRDKLLTFSQWLGVAILLVSVRYIVENNDD